MAPRAVLVVTAWLAACSPKPATSAGAGGAGSPASPISPRPPGVVDAGHAVPAREARPSAPALAVDAPPPPSSPSSGAPPPLFGVRWRAEVPRSARAVCETTTLVVLRDRILSSCGESITAFDLVNGKLAGRARVPHTRLIGDGEQLTATTDTEQFGIDPATLKSTWRASAANGLGAVGDWLVETPMASHKPVIQLRRASDGEVLWQLDEALESSVTAHHQVIGQTLYLQLRRRVAAVDIATGQVRWRRPGTLVSASGERLAIAVSPGHLSILDRDGREQWTAECNSVLLSRDIAYVTTSHDLASIDLRTNTVRWRRSAVQAIASDDAWVYARTLSPGSDASGFAVLAAATGDVVARLPVSDGEVTIAPAGAFVELNGWVVALGALAQPEPRHRVAAQVCLLVHGCGASTAPLIGAAVMLGDASATTDRRGCFRYRAQTGLLPLALSVTGGTVAGQPARFDTPFPSAVVVDGAGVTLGASWLGAGCD
jgi:outer membrane protein assembly factor BamB